MNNQNEQTFTERIASMKAEQEQAQINAQTAAQKLQDCADTLQALKALFVTNVNKLPSGEVIAIDGQRITVQLVASLAVNFPKSMDEFGKIVVACVQTLAIVDNKPIYSNIPAEIGQKGLVDSLFSGGQFRLILDSRVPNGE